MLNSNDTLPIAIAFSNLWMVEDEVDVWPVDSASVSYALSVISRMASVMYGMSLRPARNLILRSVDPLLKVSIDEDEDPLDASIIIRSFVKHIIRAVNEVRLERGIIKYVLVLVDEASILEEHIVRKYAVSRSTSTLRSALLDKRFLQEHIALLGTSLKVDAFGVIRRGIFNIQLPGRLPPNQVVDSWWLRRRSGEAIAVNETTRIVLNLLAATMCRNLRMCEFAADFIQNLDAQTDFPIDFISNRFCMKDLLNFVRQLNKAMGKRLYLLVSFTASYTATGLSSSTMALPKHSNEV